MNNEYTEIKYEALQELFGLTQKGPFAYANYAQASGNNIDKIINSYLTSVTFSTMPTALTSTYIETLIKDYLFPKYYLCYVLKYEERTAALAEWFGSFATWLRSSAEKYSLLIGNLAANKTKLLDKVQTITKFNDTPQNNAVYSVDDDRHVTTATETSADPNTLIKRLKEIEDNISELYENWSVEFEKKFIIW